MSAFFLLIFFFSIPALILGMIVPRVYARFFKKGVTRGKIAKVLGAVMLASFIIGVATAPPVEPKPETEEVTTDSAPDATEQTTDTAVSTVVKVVDGDTITVETNGVRETIRIVGINTPETVDPRKPVECFGQEASSRAKAMLDGQTVKLEADPTQGERDKYDRLLRYVFLADGSDFGKQMIVEGYAYEYTYSAAYKYQQDYKTAQAEAQAAKRGLWADGACEDVQDAPNASAGTTTTAETTAPSENSTAPTTTGTEPAAEPAPATPTASCSCSSNTYNCGDFSTHAQAQAVYDCCIAQTGSDVHKLDGSDNDGQACESLP